MGIPRTAPSRRYATGRHTLEAPVQAPLRRCSAVSEPFLVLQLPSAYGSCAWFIGGLLMDVDDLDGVTALTMRGLRTMASTQRTEFVERVHGTLSA